MLLSKVIRAMGLAGTVLVLVFAKQVIAESKYNMPVGVTDISRSIYDLHQLMLIAVTIIGIIVFGIMFYSVFAHRKSKGAKSANFHESTFVEIVWTTVPLIILIAMAVPATLTLLEMEDTEQADILIQITAYQWKWQYKYLGDDLENNLQFFSQISTPPEQIANLAVKGEHYLQEVDQALVIPVNKKIRFLITANDVIHSWWVPAFGVKKDAIPGFINEAWTRVREPGIYRGQCAELCGVNHAFMPIVVEVKTQADYQLWFDQQTKKKLAVQKASEEAILQQYSYKQLMEQGEQVYLTACAACHQVNGTGLPPLFPALKEQSLAVGKLSDHISIVLNGKAGSAMQAFDAQLNDLQLAAVITYERNAWGNNLQGNKAQKDRKDIIQPADIKAARQGAQK